MILKRLAKYLFLLMLVALFIVPAQPLTNEALVIGRVHYQGGGDWYGNKTSLKNMLQHFAATTGAFVAAKERVVKLTDPAFMQIPILYIAGHGNIVFSPSEQRNLRTYLTQGGFLFIDDDYGLDEYIRREMRKVFPQKTFIEIGASDKLFREPFVFAEGAPKIHEHHGGQPRVFGLFHQGNLICIYTYNTDISDGCEDAGIHDDSEDIRRQALNFSTNILWRALSIP
jgi:hypothetical protein